MEKMIKTNFIFTIKKKCFSPPAIKKIHDPPFFKFILNLLFFFMIHYFKKNIKMS